ncbi:MAG: alpha/beta hydrolase [Planctomycetota bacterium]|nr:alpha/beta hydrolase [Planctomycetota bacterium]
MPFLRANGLTFHVQSIGEGSPVVMLHGLLVDNLASWYFTVAPSLARNRRVVMFDLRGHGKSERARDGYSTVSMAGDLSALLDELQIDTLDLVGHSFGALVALRFALENPDRVRRLVLVEAPLPPSQLEEMVEFVQSGPEKIVQSMPDGMQGALRAGSRRAAKIISALKFLLGESSLVADLQAEGDIPDDELRQIACPVLCFYGKNSSCRSVGDRLTRIIPDTRLIELDGGHYLPLEHGATIGEEIGEFLSG